MSRGSGSQGEDSQRICWGAERRHGLSINLLMSIARKIEVGRLSLVLPDGSQHAFGDGADDDIRAVLRINRPRTVRRLLLGGTRGFAEAYMDGDWESPDLATFLRLAQANETALGRSIEGGRLGRWLDRLRHLKRANTRRGSRRNIAYHYDLGNAFYGLWLDRSMTYSAAFFDRPGLSLAAAQERKLRRLADRIELRPGMRILEIGCGWGSFALLAARDYGCHVTAITISPSQWSFTREQVRRAQLDHLIDVRLMDYRDVGGRYDRIVSIEMFEAVGEEHWGLFFDVLRERLEPGGVAGLQIITIDDERFEAYRSAADFIQAYIFPGGMLPAPAVLRRESERVGLRLESCEPFGWSYADTLTAWRARFQRAWPRIQGLGFDLRFRRMWEFYLAYCETGFRLGTIDVAQYRLARVR